MDKPVAAIEFSSRSLKLVVGYELEGKVYVLYALKKPYGLAIEAGNITEKDAIINSVDSIKQLVDPSAKLKISISEALLSLPPYGLGVFQTQQVTTVISEDGDGKKIADLEIQNIYALIKNSAYSLNNELIDVVPERYILDQGRLFSNPPLGERSTTLTVQGKVHTVPARISQGYKDLLLSGGINFKRFTIAPYAACELLGTYDDVPTDYILVDIGSHMTTVSLIGAKALYASRFFEWGGDRITDRIIEKFNINETEAEKVKVTYGLDKREMNFKAPVCTSDDGNGNEIKHYNDELNAIIKAELEVFVKELLSAQDNLLEGYDKSYHNLPMIFIGGGAMLNGFKDFVEPKVPNDTVDIIVPRSLGARNPTFLNCLGMILINAKYPNINDDSQTRVPPIQRDAER